MFREPVRFLHLTGLRVDSDPPSAPVLSTAARKALPRTVHRSLRNVVDAAIDAGVDFVLLGGETFCEDSRSLRGRIVLREAFAKLAEHNIPVLVAPGVTDPLPAWDGFPELSDSVTVLGPGESAAIERNNAVIAVVEGVAFDGAIGPDGSDSDHAAWRVAVLLPDGAAPASRSPRARTTIRPAWLDAIFDATKSGALAPRDDPHSPFDPSILNETPWDYVAPVCAERQFTVASDRSLLHSPASLAGIAGRITGPRGGSLVTLREGQRPEVQFVPLAATVQQAAAISLAPGDSENDLIERMRETIVRQPSASTQECLLMHWTVRGTGPLFRSLHDREYQQLLAGSLDDSLENRELCLGHSFRLWSSRLDRTVRVDEPDPRHTLEPAHVRPRAALPTLWDGDDSGRRAASLLEHAGHSIRALAATEAGQGAEPMSNLRQWVSDDAAAHGLKVIPRLDSVEADDVVGETGRLLDAWLDDAEDETRGNS